MFTGLIETIAEIIDRQFNGKAGKLELRCPEPFSDLSTGESIAVNGTCLTLEEFRDDGCLRFHTLSETLDKTNLSSLKIGSRVNLERALQLGDRLGGHLVSGHVDCVTPVRSWRQVGDDWELAVSYPDDLQGQLVEKGSIAIDGVSLTLASLQSKYFTVRLIPVTLTGTCLRDRPEGSLVNLETDLIGKYVLRQQVLQGGKHFNITTDKLREAGWQL